MEYEELDVAGQGLHTRNKLKGNSYLKALGVAALLRKWHFFFYKKDFKFFFLKILRYAASLQWIF